MKTHHPHVTLLWECWDWSHSPAGCTRMYTHENYCHVDERPRYISRVQKLIVLSNETTEFIVYSFTYIWMTCIVYIKWHILWAATVCLVLQYAQLLASLTACMCVQQVTGVLLCFFIIFGYTFAASWPGRQQTLRQFKVEQLFSVYEVFYVTHVIMGLALLILLIIHPWPGSLASGQLQQRGTTWIYLLVGTFVCLLERLARLYK